LQLEKSEGWRRRRRYS